MKAKALTQDARNDRIRRFNKTLELLNQVEGITAQAYARGYMYAFSGKCPELGISFQGEIVMGDTATSMERDVLSMSLHRLDRANDDVRKQMMVDGDTRENFYRKIRNIGIPFDIKVCYCMNNPLIYIHRHEWV